MIDRATLCRFIPPPSLARLLSLVSCRLSSPPCFFRRPVHAYMPATTSPPPVDHHTFETNIPRVRPPRYRFPIKTFGEFFAAFKGVGRSTRPRRWSLNFEQCRGIDGTDARPFHLRPIKGNDRDRGAYAHKLGERDVKRAPFIQLLPPMKRRKEEKKNWSMDRLVLTLIKKKKKKEERK